VGFEARPWGGYEVLSDAPTHKVKRLTVEPGQRLSYQRHSQRAEHWFVVSGDGEVTLDAVTRTVGPTSTVDVPMGAAHLIACTGSEPLVVIEVQHGSSFGEDDIERLADDYGRIVTAGSGPA
jgi:mannose-6-phosphate isomerase